MKLKQKFLISVFLFIIIFFIANPIKVSAALQANGNTSKTDTIANWLLNIRKMEETGGTLGLTDTINTTDLTSSASSSNNLDIHMQKNTEYGAMAILSASAYGNQSKINDGETTTGNKSGIYINLNKEWVSAGPSALVIPQYTSANAKYKNIYTKEYVAKAGDAISETYGWHDSGLSRWFNHDSHAGLLRACSGSIFSYDGYGYNFSYNPDAHPSNPWYTRAVIVIGNGF